MNSFNPADFALGPTTHVHSQIDGTKRLSVRQTVLEAITGEWQTAAQLAQGTDYSPDSLQHGLKALSDADRLQRRVQPNPKMSVPPFEYRLAGGKG